MTPRLEDVAEGLVYQQDDFAIYFFNFLPYVLLCLRDEGRHQDSSVLCSVKPIIAVGLRFFRYPLIGPMTDDGILEGIVEKLHVAVCLPLDSSVVEDIIDSLEMLRMEFSCEQPIGIGPDILVDDIQRLIKAKYAVMKVRLEE